jgi:hypothetical protein
MSEQKTYCLRLESLMAQLSPERRKRISARTAELIAREAGGHAIALNVGVDPQSLIGKVMRGVPAAEAHGALLLAAIEALEELHQYADFQKKSGYVEYAARTDAVIEKLAAALSRTVRSLPEKVLP